MSVLDLKAPLVLSPMCDFMEQGRYIEKIGPADIFHIEYTRVHGNTHFHDDWVGYINDLGPRQKVVAQLIGNDPDAMAKAAQYLQTLPVAGVDLNVGCPAPKIYKNNVGAGLLRDLETLNRIIGTLRDAVKAPVDFSVKFRLGFDQPDKWEHVYELLRKHGVDWCSLHLRTVADGYRGPAHYNLLADVVKAAPCPLIINGDVQSAEQAKDLIEQSGVWGVAVGRGALRYPWIFNRYRNPDATLPTYADAYDYYQWVISCGKNGLTKGYLNFLGLSIDPEGKFLKSMRRAQGFEELEEVAKEWLLSRGDEPLPQLPYPRLYARPSMEKPNPKKDPWLYQLKKIEANSHKDELKRKFRELRKKQAAAEAAYKDCCGGERGQCQ